MVQISCVVGRSTVINQLYPYSVGNSLLGFYLLRAVFTDKKIPVENTNLATTAATHTEFHQVMDLGRLSNKIVAAELQAAVLDRVQQ